MRRAFWVALVVFYPAAVVGSWTDGWVYPWAIALVAGGAVEVARLFIYEAIERRGR